MFYSEVSLTSWHFSSAAVLLSFLGLKIFSVTAGLEWLLQLFLLITVGQLSYKWGNLVWQIGPVDHRVQLDRTIDAFLPEQYIQPLLELWWLPSRKETFSSVTAWDFSTTCSQDVWCLYEQDFSSELYTARKTDGGLCCLKRFCGLPDYYILLWGQITPGSVVSISILRLSDCIIPHG